MAKPVPTSKIEEAAQQTRQQLDQIEKFHKAAEDAATRGAELEAAGDERGAQEQFKLADIENDKANELAEVVQDKIGPNHTVNGDGTISQGKASGDGFKMEELRQQEEIAEATGVSVVDVVLAGGEGTEEAMVVIEENRAEEREASTEEFIDGLLEDASIDPELATDEDIQNVVDREVMQQSGVIDMVKAQGGDPDSMTPTELAEAAEQAVKYEEYEQSGVLDKIREQGGNPEDLSAEELAEREIVTSC